MLHRRCYTRTLLSVYKCRRREAGLERADNCARHLSSSGALACIYTATLRYLRLRRAA
jgi:hypothetical protein